MMFKVETKCSQKNCSNFALQSSPLCMKHFEELSQRPGLNNLKYT